MSRTKQEIEILIKQLLFELPLTERITLIERIGKKLRQRNSIETEREVKEFNKKMGLNKRVEDYEATNPKANAKKS